MKVVSLFSGAGGLDLGFKMAGHEILWANDIYRDAVETYQHNLGTHIVCEDISKIDVKEIPEFAESEQGYITVEELVDIIVPLSGCKTEIQDYVNFILWYRAGDIALAGWPKCCTGANDIRIAREYLLFLSNYGYLNTESEGNRLDERYRLNKIISDEIREIITSEPSDNSVTGILGQIRSTEVVSEVERKRVQASRVSRPNQAYFRCAVLKACGRCIITNVVMPEVLEAAHIVPFKYKGEDTIANGFTMRTDIHILFDSGHLRIAENGDIDLSPKARMDYGASIPPRITIPSFINREFLRWRWENYNGL